MNESQRLPPASPPRVLSEKGPWPFITRRVFQLADHTQHVWSSRHHRKGLRLHPALRTEALAEQLARCLWCPDQLNWWIGTVFAVGSVLFALASVFSLCEPLAAAWDLDPLDINAIFFAGSIPFTTAAYLQLFQAANAPESPAEVAGDTNARPRSLLGWRPANIGWLSSALQFVGTILFNFNTFDAMLPSLNWFQQDLLIWVPNLTGSVLFMASGYLAFIEVCHTHWAWKPRELSWWVVFANLLGCIAFLASALTAIILPGPEHPEVAAVSVGFTLIGAVGFLFGSLLMLPESSDAAEPELEALPA